MRLTSAWGVVRYLLSQEHNGTFCKTYCLTLQSICVVYYLEVDISVFFQLKNSFFFLKKCMDDFTVHIYLKTCKKFINARNI